MGLAGIAEGESVLDLGSGGGIDCFIASKKVGSGGRVVGVDMLNEMLEKARGSGVKVAENLGYGNVEFKKGYLENIPVEDASMDVVTSNCVLNLSADKGKVLGEMYRVLRGRGRFCISDVVAGGEVPEPMRADKKLWGECVSGAITEEDFLRLSREAGFYGLNVIARYLYRVVNGINFYSITLNGYKLSGVGTGGAGAQAGTRVVYNGPFASIRDEDGIEYPAGIAVEVSAEKAGKFSAAPYGGHFSVIEPDGAPLIPESDGASSSCCAPPESKAKGKGGQCC